jgi:FixJ family two-component response regulator
MPEMPGDRLAQEIREVDPLVATVLVTGWELKESDPRASVFDLRLNKPFNSQDRVMEVVTRGMELHDSRKDRHA